MDSRLVGVNRVSEKPIPTTLQAHALVLRLSADVVARVLLAAHSGTYSAGYRNSGWPLRAVKDVCRTGTSRRALGRREVGNAEVELAGPRAICQGHMVSSRWPRVGGRHGTPA